MKLIFLSILYGIFILNQKPIDVKIINICFIFSKSKNIFTFYQNSLNKNIQESSGSSVCVLAFYFSSFLYFTYFFCIASKQRNYAIQSVQIVMTSVISSHWGLGSVCRPRIPGLWSFIPVLIPTDFLAWISPSCTSTSIDWILCASTPHLAAWHFSSC